MTQFSGGDQGLYQTETDERFKTTHLGQAHLAGTGPKGKTCRECSFFGLKDAYGKSVSPGYYSKSNKRLGCTLKPGQCLNPIPGKSSKRFPHHAASCILFEQAEKIYPASETFSG